MISGEQFQARCRTPWAKAAMVVFDKYHRKFNLQHEHLLQIEAHLFKFLLGRKCAGKDTNRDFLIQEGSAFVKRNWPGTFWQDLLKKWELPPSPSNDQAEASGARGRPTVNPDAPAALPPARG